MRYVILVAGFISSLGLGLPDGYERLSAHEKLVYQMAQVEKSQYTRLPNVNLPTCSQLVSLPSFLFLRPSFTTLSDEMPRGRRRSIHVHGTVAAVKLQLNSSRYTGFFGAGEVEGLVRLSLAAPPMLAGFTPGMGLKLYVDGAPSVDLHVMGSIDGQGKDQNFFRTTFSNTIGHPKGIGTRLIGAYFSTLVSVPNELSLAHMAAIDQRGNRPSRIEAPKRILFHPNSKLLIPPDTKNDFRYELGAISPGTMLYQISVQGEDGEIEEIGRMLLLTPFVASHYGDEKLFFRHSHDEIPI